MDGVKLQSRNISGDMPYKYLNILTRGRHSQFHGLEVSGEEFIEQQSRTTLE